MDYRSHDTDLQVIEYAIMGGFYEFAFYLYPVVKDKEMKTPSEYQELA